MPAPVGDATDSDDDASGAMGAPAASDAWGDLAGPMELSVADVATISRLQGEALLRVLRHFAGTNACPDARAIHSVGRSLAADPTRTLTATRGAAGVIPTAGPRTARAPRHWVPVASLLASAVAATTPIDPSAAVAVAHSLAAAAEPYRAVCASADEMGELYRAIATLQRAAPPAANAAFELLVRRIDHFEL
eukprot:CAMPEP_0174875394 /NCGR_PEP_ID=MMETSP1114-20130205/78273_1 /TAXON_ID=312471 /ORGANISM="Neobodo designis, Strain CCAP 1951/1" /LENGTH=191 /DNA_ID=CAMNT_0016110741 /DNA_START=166 /DNA_END=738 /DNA_ORIENTATION=+